MIEFVVILLLILLTIAPFLLGIGFGDERSFVIGAVGIMCACALVFITGSAVRGDLAHFNSDTRYEVVSVIKVSHFDAIILAETDDWRGTDYYGIECKNLRSGCPSIEDWPKNFKLIEDGNKRVIVELKGAKNEEN